VRKRINERIGKQQAVACLPEVLEFKLKKQRADDPRLGWEKLKRRSRVVRVEAQRRQSAMTARDLHVTGAANHRLHCLCYKDEYAHGICR
jgi:hypothetical protein